MANSEIKIPPHIGMIMDGNRRWAKERNLPTAMGHKHGYEKMKKVIDWTMERGVKTISLYAFSTENWNRAAEEVNFLMKLMKDALKEFSEISKTKNYRLLISGRIDDLPGDLPEDCRNAMADTKNNAGGTINICLNYGGRAEIVDAVKKIVKNNTEYDQIHEGLLKKYLYHGEISDPDIIVRTSGEQRLSGFMLWGSAYSELLFLKKYWPEMEESDVDSIIEEYGRRQRRHGGG